MSPRPTQRRRVHRQALGADDETDAAPAHALERVGHQVLAQADLAVGLRVAEGRRVAVRRRRSGRRGDGAAAERARRGCRPARPPAPPRRTARAAGAWADATRTRHGREVYVGWAAGAAADVNLGSRRRISVSIQRSTSRIISSGSRPAGAIDRPMECRSRPGAARSCARPAARRGDGDGHHRRVGGDGQPRRRPCTPWLPRGVRVPREHDHPMPCAMKRCPARPPWPRPRVRRLRSMWIMSSRPIAQPKNRISSSSRLNT